MPSVPENGRARRPGARRRARLGALTGPAPPPACAPARPAAARPVRCRAGSCRRAPPGHQHAQVLGVGAVRRHLAHDPALVQDHSRSDERQQLVEVLRDQQDRGARRRAGRAARRGRTPSRPRPGRASAGRRRPPSGHATARGPAAPSGCCRPTASPTRSLGPRPDGVLRDQLPGVRLDAPRHPGRPLPRKSSMCSRIRFIATDRSSTRLAWRSSGMRPDARGHHRRGRGAGEVRLAHEHAPGGGPAHPREHLRELGLAVARDARHAQDLAAARPRRRRRAAPAGRGRRPRTAPPRAGPASRPRRPRPAAGAQADDGPPDHHPGELALVGGARHGADRAGRGAARSRGRRSRAPRPACG